jgi:hypothetical protein
MFSDKYLKKWYRFAGDAFDRQFPRPDLSFGLPVKEANSPAPG